MGSGCLKLYMLSRRRLISGSSVSHVAGYLSLNRCGAWVSFCPVLLLLGCLLSGLVEEACCTTPVQAYRQQLALLKRPGSRQLLPTCCTTLHRLTLSFKCACQSATPFTSKAVSNCCIRYTNGYPIASYEEKHDNRGKALEGKHLMTGCCHAQSWDGLCCCQIHKLLAGQVDDGYSEQVKQYLLGQKIWMDCMCWGVRKFSSQMGP